ncbi:MAG: hypothetical protein OK455_03650 [Thaumarchaeota archaeon]|nr:hypothetical protein [Nitrososphaerota archaeon]
MADNPLAIKVLQLMVGSLVVFGGASLSVFASNQLGIALGLVHLSIGVFGLLTGFLILRTRALPRRLLIAVNVVTIAYSLFSEILVQIESLLPSFALTGSLIGTVVAIIMSGAIVYSLSRARNSFMIHTT